MRGRTETRLSDGEMMCLILAAEHMTSKEIARRLGISRHTVDQRMRKALRRLGARSRREAVRMLNRGEPRWKRPAVTFSARSAKLPAAEATGFWNPLLTWLSSTPWPIATRAQPRNMMTIGQRLLWIATIAGAASFASIVYLAGLESLARLLR